MAGDLITLPLRLGLRAASMFARATGEAAARGIELAWRMIPGFQVSEKEFRDPAEAAGVNEAEPVAAQVIAEEPPLEHQGAGGQHETQSAQPPLAPVEPVVSAAATEGSLTEEPLHISEEPVIVEERADAGVEEGVGPQVTVEEPWEGYARMKADEVIARLANADAAELAAVQLYESAKRGRRSVLNEVQRQLQLGSRPGGSPA